MKKFWLLGLALATTFAIAPAAKADQFAISLSGTGVSGAFDISATSIGGGEYDITAGNIEINGFTGTLIADPGTVGEVYYDDLTAGGIIFPDVPPSNHDYLFFDDILTSTVTSPYLDGNGILFNLSNGGVVNIFSFDGADYWTEYVNGKFLPATNNDAGGDPVSFDLTPSPEPSSLLLLGSGLLGLTAFLYRRRRFALTNATVRA
ncbi:MAG: PEP-CTERM sorting domain-containing protein [Terracidiphilus sp.]|jgi:hypothetical protein